MTSSPELLSASPLAPGDPPRLGDVVLTGRLHDTDAGVIYVGAMAASAADPGSVEVRTLPRADAAQSGSSELEPSPPGVLVVVLSEGAEDDSFGRARFLQAVERARVGGAVEVLAAEDDPEVAPWAVVGPASTAEQADAAAAPGTVDTIRIAKQLLAAVTLTDLPPTGRPAGPDYRPHWFRRRRTGRWRLWPLPWPSALTSAGRWTFVAAFALILAIASLALWLAVQIFDDQPPSPLPQPRPGPISEPPPPSTPTPTPTPTAPPTTGGPGPTGPGGPGTPPIV